jgi:hypothetical protein
MICSRHSRSQRCREEVASSPAERTARETGQGALLHEPRPARNRGTRPFDHGRQEVLDGNERGGILAKHSAEERR